jgi:hypothetical protein
MVMYVIFFVSGFLLGVGSYALWEKTQSEEI